MRTLLPAAMVDGLAVYLVRLDGYGLALACLEGVDGVLADHGRIGSGQCFHARVAAAACCLRHLFCRLDGRDHRAGDGHRQAALSELRAGLARIGLATFGHCHGLCMDVDIPLGREDVAAGLGVMPAREDVDVAGRTADGGGGGGGLCAGLLYALLL
jgi:hypothetical protein